jgi:hypothetical protein
MLNESATKKRRLLLFIGIPILFIVILVTVALLGVNTFLKPTIKNAISKIIVDGSDSLYTFSLADYTVGASGSSVDINNLSIQVDSARYRQMKAANILPPLIFSLKLSKASIRGLNPWALWRNKNINCSSIELAGSVVSLQQQKNENDTSATTQPKTLYEAIKPDINEINIGYIEVRNSDFSFKTLQEETEQKESWHFEKMGIKVSDIKVDANSHKDTTRILYASNLHAGFDSLSIKATDGMYKYDVGKTAYDFKDRTVIVEHFKLRPSISQDEFNRRMGHEADRFSADVEKVTVNNFNAAAFLAQSRIKTGTILLSNPVFSIYKDKRAGPNNSNKMGKYPHQLLLKATTPISIDSIKIKGGQFTYTEKSLKTFMDGSFKFNNVNGVIPNITNSASEIAKNGWCKADLTASFMGDNDMRAIFSFDLASNDGHFMVDATLASLTAGQINAIFRPLAKAELETFVLDKLAYHVEGNDHSATGNLRLLYHDLKLNVLKTDADGNFQKKGLITMLANVLKLYSSNPESGEQERKATGIKEQRIPTKNFFGLVIRTLLSCTQEIALKGKNKTLPGLGGKKQENNSNEAKANDKKSDEKANKENDKRKEKERDKKNKDKKD